MRASTDLVMPKRFGMTMACWQTPGNKAGRACMRQARPEYVTRNIWGAPGGEERSQGRVGFRPLEGEEWPETLRPPAEGGEAGRTSRRQ